MLLALVLLTIFSVSTTIILFFDLGNILFCAWRGTAIISISTICDIIFFIVYNLKKGLLDGDPFELKQDL